jgi:hypothetical protein
MTKGLNEKKVTVHFSLDIKNWGLVTLQTSKVINKEVPQKKL